MEKKGCSKMNPPERLYVKDVIETKRQWDRRKNAAKKNEYLKNLTVHFPNNVFRLRLSVQVWIRR